MVEDGAYCVDILNQVAAVNGALKAFSRVLLENHIRTCVREDAHQGGDEKLDELIEVLERLMK